MLIRLVLSSLFGSVSARVSRSRTAERVNDFAPRVFVLHDVGREDAALIKLAANAILASKIQKIRWNFRHRQVVLVGIPGD